MKSKAGAIKLILFFLSIFYCSMLSAQVPFYQQKASFKISYSLVSTNVNSRFWITETVSDTTKKNDRDGDGIIDSLDKCPDEKGVLQYDGCPVPDTDNDGVADDIDNCPTVAGTIKYKGCPVPDTDGDKINDEVDKCPTVPGVARYDGCPVGDRDGDGVNDDDDKCIDIAGTVKNGGCPENKKSVRKSKNKKQEI